MAADQGIVNAYNRYFQAQEQADLLADPMYQFTQLATMAAKEWQNEMKRDYQRARKRADGLQGNIDDMFMNSLDGFNPQTQELAYSHLEVLTNKMDAAARTGDKKLMNQIFSEAQAFSKQFQTGQALIAEHAKNIKEGTYSEGAGTASLNKFLSADPEDYETFMATSPEEVEALKEQGMNVELNKLYFRIKDNNGGLSIVSVDELDKGNVKRADEFGDGYEALIKKMVKEASQTGVEKFDEEKVEKLLKRSLADSDVLYSSFHDDIFGAGSSIKEQWDASHRGANRDWQFMWNDQLPPSDEAITGSIQNSGYNEDQMREYTQKQLMDHARKEYNSRLAAWKNKTKANNNSSGNTVETGPHKYTNKEVLKTTVNNIQNREKLYLNSGTFVPQDDGSWVVEGGENDGTKMPTTESLIKTIASWEEWPYILMQPSLGFTKLYAPPIKYNPNK